MLTYGDDVALCTRLSDLACTGRRRRVRLTTCLNVGVVARGAANLSLLVATTSAFVPSADLEASRLVEEEQEERKRKRMHEEELAKKSGGEDEEHGSVKKKKEKKKVNNVRA